MIHDEKTCRKCGTVLRGNYQENVIYKDTIKILLNMNDHTITIEDCDDKNEKEKLIKQIQGQITTSTTKITNTQKTPINTKKRSDPNHANKQHNTQHTIHEKLHHSKQHTRQHRRHTNRKRHKRHIPKFKKTKLRHGTR